MFGSKRLDTSAEKLFRRKDFAALIAKADALESIARRQAAETPVEFVAEYGASLGEVLKKIDKARKEHAAAWALDLVRSQIPDWRMVADAVNIAAPEKFAALYGQSPEGYRRHLDALEAAFAADDARMAADRRRGKS